MADFIECLARRLSRRRAAAVFSALRREILRENPKEDPMLLVSVAVDRSVALGAYRTTVVRGRRIRVRSFTPEDRLRKRAIRDIVRAGLGGKSGSLARRLVQALFSSLQRRLPDPPKPPGGGGPPTPATRLSARAVP